MNLEAMIQDYFDQQDWRENVREIDVFETFDSQKANTDEEFRFEECKRILKKVFGYMLEMQEHFTRVSFDEPIKREQAWNSQACIGYALENWMEAIIKLEEEDTEAIKAYF